MYKQLYQEHLKLQKAFCNLYGHFTDRNNNGMVTSNLVQEKHKLESILSYFQRKVLQLENELHLSKERCELLEFCFLELEQQAKTFNNGDAVDQGVNTDLCWITLDSSVKCFDNPYSLQASKCCPFRCIEENCDIYACQYILRNNKKMDQDQCRKKLDESRKKLSAICKQLDLVSGTGPEKREWRCIHEIVSSVEELQSLIAWIIEKRGTKEESSVITQKLQKLNRIRKVLEKSASESQKYLWPLLNQEHRTVSDLELQKSFKCCENSDISSRRKVVNFDLPCESASTTPTKSDNTFDFTDCSSEETLYDHSEDPDKNFDLVEDKNKKAYIGENFAPFHSLAKPCMVHETEYQHDSLCTAVSEDEGLGEESRRGDSTGPNSLLEIPDPMSDLPFDLSLPPEAFCDETPPCLPNNSSWTLDSSNHRNSLELCLATIAKLKTALSGKEDELLKLKSDRIAEDEVLRLKSVVENLKKDVENLQLKVKTLEKENESLKEQVLELEEAENDARFKGQHLQEKLIFLQEKDNHFQTELSEAKRSLELCIEELSLKDNEERELQSQLKYMEVLVQKYEDQIRRMELSESDLKHSLKRMDEKHREIIRNLEIKKTKGEEKGTQTYTDPNALHPSSESSQESVHESVHFSSNEYPFITTDEDEFILIPPAFRSVYCDKTNVAVQTDELSRNSTPVNKFPQLVCVGCETDHSGHEGSVENCSPVPILTCPVQKELLKRLHNLAEEDADLQQQLHHVDQINLSLWQKLHDLQFHIGECQKENLSEDESSRVDNVSDNRSSTERSTQLTPSNEVLSNYSALFCSEFNDEKLKDRLTNLENINASFLKQLELREQLCAETEKKHSEWVQAEHQFLEELKLLKTEKDSLLSQISQLEAEKNQLRIDLEALETELNFLREKNERELSEILSERDSMLSEKQTKIDSLRAKEKDHMKQISKLQCEKRKGEERSEFETLKNSYVQLQIELEQCRDEMGSMKQEFERQLRFLRDKHRSDENRMVQALESLREKDSDCNKKLSEVQASQAEMENALTLKEKELENARSEFKLAMQATEEQHKLVEDELRKKLYQMEEGTAVATKALTEEKRRLEKELQGNIDDLRSKEAVYKSRIQELETNVAQLHTELHRLTGNLRVKCDAEETSTGIASFQRERLLKELQELRVREGELREKLDEMEKKEAAYRETLEHADRIVASVERGYKNKIEELELSEKSLKQKVGYLEEVENGLRIALQRERRSSDGRKPEELVVELTEAEKRENTLKEELSKLEQSHRNLSQKVKDLEKIRENLESQLSDREDLALSLEKVKKEQETTKKELLKLKKSEGSFQLALEQTENLLKTREADMEAEVQRFTDEKKGLEETIHQLRSQVRDLEQQLEKHRAEELESENDVCGYSEAEVLNGSPLATLNQEYSSDQTTADDNETQVEQNAVWPQLECEPLNYRTLPSNDARSLFFNCDPNRKPETACGKDGAAILSDEETGRQNNCLDNCDTRHPDDAGNYGVHSLSNHNNVMGYNSNVFPRRSEPIRTIENIPMNEAEGVRSSSVPSSDLEPSRMDSEYHKVRLHLEQCMLRAMDAMKMEMENKANSASPERYTPEANECIMHPPLNFHVVQQVGSDTVLVGWEYSPISTLVGFEVYVNGQLHETVLTPDRRKAVISDLNLSQPLTLSIYAISSTGQVSEPQTIQLDTNSKQGSGFFFQEDDDDDDDFFDDVSSREIRPYSMEW